MKTGGLLIVFSLFAGLASDATAEVKMFSIAEIKKQNEDPDVVRARKTMAELGNIAHKSLLDSVQRNPNFKENEKLRVAAEKEVRNKTLEILEKPIQRKNTYAIQIKAFITLNPQHQKDLYRMCAELGNSSCMESLAIDLLSYGKTDEGIKWMEKGCLAQYDIEEHSACFRVAEEYASESNPFKDSRKAAFWFKKHVQLDANGRFGARQQIIDAGYGRYLK